MAFGGLLGTLVGSSLNIPDPAPLTGSVSVALNDLVYVAFGQSSDLTATGGTDNLGNTYSAVRAGSDPGSITATQFYSLITNAGTLTQIDIDCTGSSANYAAIAAVLEGPYAASPVDQAPAHGSDNTGPHTCPSSGTLTQADESVCCFICASGNAAVYTATSPNLLATTQNDPGNIIRCAVGYQTVTATTAVQPVFANSGTNPTTSIVGTSSFMKAGGQPAAKRMGGAGFAQDFRRGQNTNLWRRAAGLLLPLPPSVVRA